MSSSVGSGSYRTSRTRYTIAYVPSPSLRSISSCLGPSNPFPGALPSLSALPAKQSRTYPPRPSSQTPTPIRSPSSKTSIDERSFDAADDSSPPSSDVDTNESYVFVRATSAPARGELGAESRNGSSSSVAAAAAAGERWNRGVVRTEGLYVSYVASHCWTLLSPACTTSDGTTPPVVLSLTSSCRSGCASEGVSELRRERVWVELARDDVDRARVLGVRGGRDDAEGERNLPVGPAAAGPLNPLVVVDPASAVPNQLNSRPSVPPCAPSSHSPTPTPGVHRSSSPSSSSARRLRPETLEAREWLRLALRLTPRPPLGPGLRTRVWCVMPERNDARWVLAPETATAASDADESVGDETGGAAGGKSDAVGGMVGDEGDETRAGCGSWAVANCTELLLNFLCGDGLLLRALATPAPVPVGGLGE